VSVTDAQKAELDRRLAAYQYAYPLCQDHRETTIRNRV
jgi:hypothetical protein